MAGDESTPSRKVARREAVAVVLTGLARLSPDQRAVVRMRFLEERSVSEIARHLAKTEGAVHTLTHRGLKACAQAMSVLTA